MSKLLLVEDDEFLREAIKDYLTSAGHTVAEAPNGLVARDVLGTNDFDLVITDIKMPHFDGVELLEWSQKKNPVPFIIMTGFSHLLETQTAHELGAKEFLVKPFKNSELNAAIQKVLKPVSVVPGKPAQSDENSFCKVSIDEFVAKPHIEFDVYVKLPGGKYICIGRAGSEIPRERIGTYKSKGVRFLHIKKDDFKKLVNFNLQLGHILEKRKDIPKEKKLNFMKYTGEAILEKAYVSGADKECFDEAKDYLNMSVNVISDQEEFVDLLELLNSHADYVYAHSIGVAMHSIMIARMMGFESQQVFFKLSMAGLFHDIGKKEIDRPILEKSRVLLTPEERRLIETHPTRSKEILLSIRGIPDDIIQLAYEHHEDAVGQGFPCGSSYKSQHPLSKIMQVAVLFVEAALVSPHNPEGRPAPAAISYIENVYGSRVDEKVLAALKAIFGDEKKQAVSA